MSAKENEEKKPLKDVYALLRWIYSGTGGWRVDSPKKSIRIGYAAFKAFTYVSYMFHLTSIYLGAALAYDNIQMFCFCLTYIIICNVGLTKIFLLELHIQSLKKLENRLDNDLYLPWMGNNEREKFVKKKNADMLTTCTKFIFFIAAFGVTVTIFSPVFPNSKQVFIIPTPFDYLLKTPLFLPIYLYQEFSLLSFITAFVAYDLVFVGIILRLCDQMEIITLNLREIELSMPDDGIKRESGFESANLLYANRKCGYVPDENDSKQQDSWMKEKHSRLIKNCIAHHQAVFREIKLIGQIYSFTTFQYVFCGPVLMGLLAYVILSGTAAKNILIQQACYAGPACIFLFMQCYFGTQLSIKCEAVRFAFYDCPWYSMDVKTRKLIVTALITMEKTGKLRAGKFVDVALTTFLWSLKVSYNIVTFLKNTT